MKPYQWIIFLLFSPAYGDLQEYNQEGRLTIKIEGERKTTYEYDYLGRLTKTKYWINEEEHLAEIQLYDDLERTIEFHKEDQMGTLLYWKKLTHDAAGNIIREELERSAGRSVILKAYDSQGRLTKETNEMGQTTTISYDSEKITIHPNGLRWIETLDGSGRTIHKKQLDPEDQLLKEEFFSYDKDGNLFEKKEPVFRDGVLLHTVVTRWTHNRNHQVELVQEAYGTPLQRDTRYSYNSSGKLIKIEKADGTLLHFRYNALGMLITLLSEGHPNPIHYKWFYDRHHNVIQIKNCLTKAATNRIYNRYHEVVKEVFETGAEISYEYDTLGRLVCVTYPGDHQIIYEYDSLYLRRVYFNDSCVREYLDYDLSGELIQSELANLAGTERITRDLQGKILRIQTPYWSQDSIKYTELGKLLSCTLHDKIGTCEKRYCYNFLGQLLSEEGSSTHFYNYDSSGNRFQKNANVHYHNQLCQNDSFLYDSVGNLIHFYADEEIKIEYDALDRPITLCTPVQTLFFTYDAFGRCLTTTLYSPVENWTKSYFYLGDQEVGCFKQNQLEELRVLGHQNQAVLHLRRGSEITTPIHDAEGNVVTELAQGWWSTSVVGCTRYTAFGEMTDLLENPVWGYKAMRHDESIPLIYNAKGFYIPSLALSPNSKAKYPL